MSPISVVQNAKRSSQHLACQRDFALHKLAKKLQEANLAARRRRRQRQQQETAASERWRRGTPATAEAAAGNGGERARNERHTVPSAASSNGQRSTFRPVRSFFSRTVSWTEDNLTLLCRFMSYCHMKKIYYHSNIFQSSKLYHTQLTSMHGRHKRTAQVKPTRECRTCTLLVNNKRVLMFDKCLVYNSTFSPSCHQFASYFIVYPEHSINN